MFESYGLQKVKLPAGPKPTYTQAAARYGDCIVKTTRHVTAIVGGVVRDTYDTRCYDWCDYHGAGCGDAICETVEPRERKATMVFAIG